MSTPASQNAAEGWRSSNETFRAARVPSVAPIGKYRYRRSSSRSLEGSRCISRATVASVYATHSRCSCLSRLNFALARMIGIIYGHPIRSLTHTPSPPLDHPAGHPERSSSKRQLSVERPPRGGGKTSVDLSKNGLGNLWCYEHSEGSGGNRELALVTLVGSRLLI